MGESGKRTAIKVCKPVREKFALNWIIYCNYQYLPGCQWSLSSVISVIIFAAAVALVGSSWWVGVRSWTLCSQLSCSWEISALLTWGVAKGLVQWLRFVGDKHSSNTCNLSGMALRGRYWWKRACWNTVTSLTLYWTLAKFYPLLWYGKKSTTCLPHASYIFVFLLSCPVCPLSSPISFCTC